VTNELEALELEALELQAQMDPEAPSAQHLPHPYPIGTGDFQNRINDQDTLVDTEDFLGLEGDS